MPRGQNDTIYLLQRDLAEEPRLNRRRHGRVRCERLRVAKGEVVDLSQEGVRVVIRSWKPLTPGDEREVVFQVDGGELRVRAEIRWVGPRKRRVQEAGLHFLRLSDEAKVCIRDIAREFSSRHTMDIEWSSRRRSA